MTEVELIDGPCHGSKIVICGEADDPYPPLCDGAPVYVQTRDGVCHYVLALPADLPDWQHASAHFVDLFPW